MSDQIKNFRIGLDLGGTKIEAIALDRTGKEVARKRVSTPREDYAATVEAIRALVESVEQQIGGSAHVGIGIPGALSPTTGLVRNANSTWIIGKPFDKDLEAALGRPIRLANDANCLAVSEASDGAAKGHSVVFGVILGTGVGGGIAIDGKVLVGRNAIAGEWGHNPLPRPTPDEYPGPACYCGKVGCVETWLSGPGAAAEFQRVTGRALKLEDIVKTAASGDLQAVAALDRYAERLARSLSVVINILDPDAIVLGGGVSNVESLYPKLPALLDKECFSDGVTTPVLKSVHGDSSGVRGAAWLWPAA
jgi:fructokinase